MSAIDTAKLAIDANFEINGVAATYHSTWPSDGMPCKVLPDQPDIDIGLEAARVTNQRSAFVVRASEGFAPAQGGFLVVADVRYRINEAPVPDPMRLLYRLKAVKQ